MSQKGNRAIYLEAINRTIYLPLNSKAQDIFIGLWRQAQEMAIEKVKYDSTFLIDIDKTIDEWTYHYYLKLKGGNNVYRRNIKTQ